VWYDPFCWFHDYTCGGSGFAFVIQSSGSMALGASGSGLAYHGLNNAVVVEFDCWQDSGKNDVNYNHISINVKSGASDSNDAYSVAK